MWHEYIILNSLLRKTAKAEVDLPAMQRPAHYQEMFYETPADAEEISPSITIRRMRRVKGGGSAACDVVYTENLWEPINNTLASRPEFEAWQAATQWVIVTDESYNGLASFMLQGCEVISSDATNVLLVTPKRLTETLMSMDANIATVLVLAVEDRIIDFCTKQLDVWMQTGSSNISDTSKLHMLWLPTSRSEQTLPVHTALEALHWCSYTILCDLAYLPPTEDDVKASLLTMLRTAIFIDAQFIYWLEGNLTAMAETNEQLHQSAVMRAANIIFTLKRHRNNEPSIPMAFTDSVALHRTQVANQNTPNWQVQARQLWLDVRYSQAIGNLAQGDVDRVERVMISLDLMSAAQNSTLLNPVTTNAQETSKPFVIIQELGKGISTTEFIAEAWEQAL